MSYRNRGIIQYSAAEKAAYRRKRSRMVGRGDYAIKRRVVSRRRRYIRGKGRYSFPKISAPSVGRSLGSTGGAIIGSMIAPGIGTSVGSALGSGLGEALGHGFKYITGYGDYTINHNVLLYPDQAVPSFGSDTIRVRKREYITDIISSTSFSNEKFSVNPGLSETFPWLSSIANNYEQYRWNGLIFEFVSQSAVALSTSTDIQLGTVCMASDYNARDPEYIDLPQMLSTMFSNSGRPSDNILHAVECAPSDVAQKLYYIRSSDAPPNSDLRLYDMLSMQVGCKAIPGTPGTAIGQLWVNYDVTFCKSVQNNQVGFDLNTDVWHLPGPCTQVGIEYFGPPQPTDHYASHLLPGSNFGCTLNSNEIIFPPSIASGWYLINISWDGGSNTVSIPTFAYTNCEVVNVYNNNGGAFNNPDGGSQSAISSETMVCIQVVKILNRDAMIILSSGILPSSGTGGAICSCALTITQVNGEIYVNQ